MENQYLTAMATFPNKESAKSTARLLVAERLAACVQMIPIESVYLWEDKVNEDQEILLLIKSRADLFENISECIQSNHPYEVPEIIQLPIKEGLPAYLNWIDDVTNNAI